MTSLRTYLLTAAATGAVLAPAAVAQAAPTPLAVEQAPTRIAAWEGTVMWSHFDPATKTYSLVKSVGGGAPVPVGVAPRSGSPFDIDLGTSRSGATYAVYTRHGDIYRLNVASGSEVKIDKLSAPTRAERDPTIQRGEIAFIRRNAGRDELRIGNTTSGSKGSRLLVRKRSILKPELGVKHIMYVVTGPGPITDDGAQFLRIRNLRTGADRQVYRAVTGGANIANVDASDVRRQARGLPLGAHEHRLGHRQPDHPLHAARLHAHVREGLAVLQLDGLGRRRARRRHRLVAGRAARAAARAPTPASSTARSGSPARCSSTPRRSRTARVGTLSVCPPATASTSTSASATRSARPSPRRTASASARRAARRGRPLRRPGAPRDAAALGPAP